MRGAIRLGGLVAACLIAWAVSARATVTPTETPTPFVEPPTETPTETAEPTPIEAYFGVDRNVIAARLGEQATITWRLRHTARIQIRIYNTSGEIVVETFVDEVSPGGELRAAVWNGRNDDDDPCASGVYAFRVFAPFLLEHYLLGIVD